MIDKTVILVSGYKRSGKDFVSSLLQGSLDSSVLYSLAKPLKDIIAKTFNISLENLEHYKNVGEHIFTHTEAKKENGEPITDFRSVLQIFGSEAMKKWFGDSVWVDVFLKQKFEEDTIIITDWRFPVEYEKIKDKFSRVITVRVEDKNIINTDMHSSETAIEDFLVDFRIDNSAKDDSVVSPLERIIEEVLKKRS